jgi:hypothetical protein
MSKPHDWVTFFIAGSESESKDTLSQCARCNLVRHDYEYDGGRQSPHYPLFVQWGRARRDDPGCTRGDMTDEVEVDPPATGKGEGG